MNDLTHNLQLMLEKDKAYILLYFKPEYYSPYPCTISRTHALYIPIVLKECSIRSIVTLISSKDDESEVRSYTFILGRNTGIGADILLFLLKVELYPLC